MKKTLLLSIALTAASTAAMAQNGLTILSAPDSLENYAFTISANGQYVAGRYSDDVTGYVTDWKTGATKTAATDEAEEKTYFYNVANNGTAFGYVGSQAATLSIDGTVKLFGDSAIVKDGTNDATLFVGNEYNNAVMYPHACIWDKDGNRQMLPEPTDSWAGYVVNGTSAEFISPDSSVIVGYTVDDFYTSPVAIWHLNRDGKTYSLDLSLQKKYFAAGWDMVHPYTTITPMGLSDNGQWISLSLVDQDYNSGMARYNLTTDSIEVCMGSGRGSTPIPVGIADDGTLVGYDWSGGAIIWKAGEASYKNLSEAYVGATKLADFDANGNHMAIGISADGRYIVGQGYLPPSDPESYYNELYSYVLDTQDPGATTAITTATTTKGDSTVKARYNINGQRLNRDARGVNLLKMANGDVRKVIKK